MEILQYHFELHILNFTKYFSGFRAYDFSIRLIHKQYKKKKKRKKGKRKVQEVPQLHTAALPRHQEEEETDKSKQAQIEQTYEKH